MAQNWPNFFIGTRHTTTPEAQSGPSEPPSARRAQYPRQTFAAREGIERARLGLVRLSRGLGVLGKRRSEVGSSIPIDYLPHGGRDGRLGEACEVRVETGACTHARVGLVVVPAIVDDAPMLRLARSACRMQVSVSSMRPTRGRSAGRPVTITCFSSS